MKGNSKRGSKNAPTPSTPEEIEWERKEKERDAAYNKHRQDREKLARVRASSKARASTAVLSPAKV